MRLLFLTASLLLAAITVAQTQKAGGLADFIDIDAPVLVLEHVRVIDGTGMPAKEGQAVVIANCKIQFIGPEEPAQIPPGAQRMGLSGYTVIPGLGGMHNHLYYTRLSLPPTAMLFREQKKPVKKFTTNAIRNLAFV